MNSTPQNQEAEALVEDLEQRVAAYGTGEVAIRIFEGGGEEEDPQTGLLEQESNVDNGRENVQRYDIKVMARWVKQILPLLPLLLVLFVRLLRPVDEIPLLVSTLWITDSLFKFNEIVRKQTALKGERKMAVLIAYFLVFVLYIIGIFSWHSSEDIYYPLFMVPPKTIPPFWRAIFIILFNDTMARQVAMTIKLILLMYYINGRGHNFLIQGQMLTLVEYTLLVYRALLPIPVWYRFFLNKEYGSLFSSLITGLYLTFKLTTIVEKVQSFFTAVKACNYECHATSEQVNAAGDLCAICQDTMNAPILLRCKHIFCEDCVSEWFERQRTCPLCRALVRPVDLRTFEDGSTSLFFRIC